MNVKDLRSAIIRSLDYAQESSRAPTPSEHLLTWESELRKLNSERDRMQTLLAFLAGSVQDGDPKLAKAIKAFMDAKPGEPLPGQATPAPAAAITPPSPQEAA